MSLITPDFGLLFWMVLIFGVVFFILAKAGFPVITGMVDKRSEAIAKSLKDAREIEEKMTRMNQECREIMDQARREQNALITEATETKKHIIEQAKEQAREEAQKIVSDARLQISAEKESALRDVRKEVSMLSVAIAEKILRRELSSDRDLEEYVSTLLDEADKMSITPPVEE
ncbi:MAG: F0F1 ATP synthase subunit B [Acutalibacteraceae bacterium]|nr:F0F1 ATP synthase subunit B [Bacteroidales bacterium]MEE3312368.1 F0F1 ATP synthase subunit B [Acutalibacteraceae bacterium]